MDFFDGFAGLGKRARETFQMYGETAENIAVAFGAPAIAVRASASVREYLGGGAKRRRTSYGARKPNKRRSKQRRGTALRYTSKRTTRVYKKGAYKKPYKKRKRKYKKPAAKRRRW